MARSFRVDTIGKLIELNHSLTAHCFDPKCQHSGKLDLMELAWKLGPYHGCGADALEPKLRCTKCGGKRVGIQVDPQFQENLRRGTR